jgi:hypothetical protein
LKKALNLCLSACLLVGNGKKLARKVAQRNSFIGQEAFAWRNLELCGKEKKSSEFQYFSWRELLT